MTREIERLLAELEASWESARVSAPLASRTFALAGMTVALVGAELNAEMEHQTARDTTTGRPLPLGARGARMADRVAPPEA